MFWFFNVLLQYSIYSMPQSNSVCTLICTRAIICVASAVKCLCVSSDHNCGQSDVCYLTDVLKHPHLAWPPSLNSMIVYVVLCASVAWCTLLDDPLSMNRLTNWCGNRYKHAAQPQGWYWGWKGPKGKNLWFGSRLENEVVLICDLAVDVLGARNVWCGFYLFIYWWSPDCSTGFNLTTCVCTYNCNGWVHSLIRVHLLGVLCACLNYGYALIHLQCSLPKQLPLNSWECLLGNGASRGWKLHFPN